MKNKNKNRQHRFGFMAGRQGSNRHLFGIHQQFQQTLRHCETEYILYVNSLFGSVTDRRISNTATSPNRNVSGQDMTAYSTRQQTFKTKTIKSLHTQTNSKNYTGKDA